MVSDCKKTGPYHGPRPAGTGKPRHMRATGGAPP